MAGTIKGGKTGAAKILARDPDFFKRIGARGGKNSSGYEFSHGKISPVEAGKLGGRPRKNKISV